ncbi:MAG: hypothetical protein HN855_06490 [Anaerolineae bacterium]|jgi:hypothetical protein|nr:hypothetical protein [Anaerolineae bacterium]MBT7071833.1 hypothetical protein [Anaerolineae bacterium]MBT7324786.1 hypothetical protein [Anaerolineae bacterium]MBT7601365.1 hypothetical protein [Anaerolineae bacterium]
MLKRFGLTLLLTIIGGILGISLAIAFVWGWLDAGWQQIEASPEPIARLISIERDQVWVESESGILYKYTDAENCQSDCWTVVNSIPDPVWYDNPDPIETKDTTCSPALLLFNVEERIEQCHIEMWVSRNYVFALRENGNLYFWQSDIYGEWLVIELFFGLCTGAICLSVPAFLFILLPGILKWFSKRQKR